MEIGENPQVEVETGKRDRNEVWHIPAVRGECRPSGSPHLP